MMREWHDDEAVTTARGRTAEIVVVDTACER